MKSTFAIFALLALGTSLLHAQTAAPAAAPTAPVVKRVLPFSSNDQMIARSVSLTLQNNMLIALCAKRRADDASLSSFSTKLSGQLIKQWTPFVNVCQAHQFSNVATEASKSLTEDVAKMRKEKGADFRKEYFKRLKMEVTRGVQFTEASLLKVQEADLKAPLESMMTLFKTVAGELEEASKAPITPSAAAEKKGAKADPKKK